MLFLTTTAIDLDEELLNRCLVLTVNESREQTRAIHGIQRQRETLEGLMAQDPAGRAAGPPSQRPAAAPAPGGGEPLRRPAELPGRPDAQPGVTT